MRLRPSGRVAALGLALIVGAACSDGADEDGPLSPAPEPTRIAPPPTDAVAPVVVEPAPLPEPLPAPDALPSESDARYVAERRFAEEKIERFLREKVIRGWESTRTPHYLVVYDEDVDRRRIVERIVKESEDLYEQLLVDWLPPALPDTAITIVRICESRQQFAAYGAPPGSAGYWSPYHEEVVLYQDAHDRKDAVRVFRSIATQAHVHNALRGAPVHPWFGRGHGDVLAGYALQKTGRYRAAPFRWRAGTAREAKDRWAKGLERASDATRLTLPEWLTWGPKEFHGRNDWELAGGVNYALAWSLVYFLRNSRDERHAAILDRYWATLAGLVRAEAAEAADLEEETTTDRSARKEWPQRALSAALEGVDIDRLERAWLRAGVK